MTRHMILAVQARLALVTMVLVPVTAGGQSPAAPAPALYADAVAKETAVRAAFGEELSPDALHKAVRTVVADYERFVRTHTTSGYSDDSLWRAGNLSLEAFRKL